MFHLDQQNKKKGIFFTAAVWQTIIFHQRPNRSIQLGLKRNYFYDNNTQATSIQPLQNEENLMGVFRKHTKRYGTYLFIICFLLW